MSPVASMGIGPQGHTASPRRPPRIDPAPALRRRHRFNDMPHMELVIRFVAWAYEQHSFPTVEAVQDRFQVSRATAYRWRNALADAHGIQCPANEPEEGAA